MTPEEMRAYKAKSMRYKKPIVRDLNLQVMTDNLYEMQEECSDVRWAFEGDDGDEIINAMLGGEEEAQEFKMMFSDLSAEVDRFIEDIGEFCYDDLEKYYDIFMVNGNIACDFGGLYGYDSYEGDYFGLSSGYDEEAATREAREKLKKNLTKDKLLEVFRDCMKIFTSYVGLQYRYDCLKASMDILRERNAVHMKAVAEINSIYVQADKETSGFRYQWHGEAIDRLNEIIKAMPQEAFL